MDSEPCTQTRPRQTARYAAEDRKDAIRTNNQEETGMTVMTGLSGNEIYCLNQKGFQPGDLVIGNSVFSLGFLGTLGSGLRNLVGGEVTQVTSVIHDGRQLSYERLMAEAQKRGGVGITGVTSQIVQLGNTVEFLSIGSCLHAGDTPTEQFRFSTSSDGQELYCELDSGFQPIKFVFGNVAYSIGVGGSLMAGLKALARGEVPQYSHVFNDTRHLALQRIAAEAQAAGANAVLGIRTSIVPFKGMQEMVMLGTASHHPSLPPEYAQSPITSDLTNQEMWNLVHVGYMPLKLLLGVSVYSLGLAGKITSAFKGLARREIEELSSLIYEARFNAISRIMQDANACGADDVVGIKTYVYELGGGLIEFMAIGTAVKRMPGIGTLSDSLPPQAIIDDKDTFINTAETAFGVDVSQKGRTNRKRDINKDKGPVTWWDVIKAILRIAGG
jgi:uncharacterized protein YbjQ (UPF0145 family)